MQVVDYRDIQFTKTPEVLRGMGLALEKTEKALAELREQGSPARRAARRGRPAAARP